MSLFDQWGKKKKHLERVTCGGQNSEISLGRFVWISAGTDDQSCFHRLWFIFRSFTESPGFSWLPVDHMVSNDSQDENIPPLTDLAMVSVKRAICWALFWDIFTNFHVKFICTGGLFPFWQVPIRDSEYYDAQTNSAYFCTNSMNKPEQLIGANCHGLPTK